MSGILDPEKTPIIGKYEVLEHLGSGAMASVYKVRHTQLKSVYALKILDGALGRMQDRLMREGRVQAALRHPNVVSVHDVLEVEGQPGLLMEFVSGPSLSSHILANEPLSVEEIDRLARGIIKGVRAAHAAGHLHRDLKPANILLQPLDDELVPKIADFGLVKVLGRKDDPTQTRTGQLLGSPAYMSPEQTVSATDLDQRTDVWALGTVLYQLVTGRLAFPQRDLVTVFSMIRSGDFRDPRALRERIPERMWNAILGAMTVNAERRIQDCDQLLGVWTGKIDFEAEMNESLSTLIEDDFGPAMPTADFPTEPAPTPAPVPVAGTKPAPPVPSSTTTRDRSLPWIPFAVGVGVVLLGIAIGTQIRPAAPTPPAPVPTAPPSPPPVPSPPPEPPAPDDPTPQLQPEPAPEPAQPSSPPAPQPAPPPTEPATRPDPDPNPKADVPQPAPPAEPAGPAPARFVVTGDAEKAWLVRNGTHFEPGDIEPGRYTIAARFPGRPLAPVDGVVVDLAPGQAITIECKAGFFTCRAL